MAGTDIVHVVDTLESMDLLVLDQPGPWRGEPAGEAAFEVSWHEVEAPLDRRSELTTAAGQVADNWSRVTELLVQDGGGGPLIPPADVLDADAWYLPVHYYGLATAIYIRESAVVDVARMSHQRLPTPRQHDLDAAWGSVRAALGMLYLHEAFHHKVESFATRAEVVERRRRYHAYSTEVYGALARQESDDLLEEALACAEMVRRLKAESVYSEGIPSDVLAAALEMLHDWIPTLGPGYRTGLEFISSAAFARAQNQLSSQIQEAAIHPMRRHDEWSLTPHMFRGLFTQKSVTHVLVPRGLEPVIPWFGRSPVPLSISTRDLTKALTARGYAVVKGGKGSHVKLKAPGRPTLILPGGRESLSPGVLRNIASALGLRSSLELSSLV